MLLAVAVVKYEDIPLMVWYVLLADAVVKYEDIPESGWNKST